MSEPRARSSSRRPTQLLTPARAGSSRTEKPARSPKPSSPRWRSALRGETPSGGGRARIAEAFSIERMTHDTLSVYAEALAQ